MYFIDQKVDLSSEKIGRILINNENNHLLQPLSQAINKTDEWQASISISYNTFARTVCAHSYKCNNALALKKKQKNKWASYF